MKPLKLSFAAVKSLWGRNRTQGVLFFSSSPSPSPTDYCMELVKSHDHENFLSTLLLPNSFRTSALAVRAFNIEVARVQDIVSESRIGQMRMKFWEEMLEKLYQNDVPKHPVAIQLHRAVKKHKLSKRYLKRLITVRENYLVSSMFPDIEAMEAYAEQTVSSIYYLLLECAGMENVHADHVASHLGKAQGITNLIRSLEHNAQHKIITLPQDILLQNNISHESILRGLPSEDLTNAIFAVASRAKQHLEKARSLSAKVPKDALVVFLPAVCVDSYLQRLQNNYFNIFDSTLQRRNALLPFSLYWSKFRHKY